MCIRNKNLTQINLTDKKQPKTRHLTLFNKIILLLACYQK